MASLNDYLTPSRSRGRAASDRDRNPRPISWGWTPPSMDEGTGHADPQDYGQLPDAHWFRSSLTPDNVAGLESSLDESIPSRATLADFLTGLVPVYGAGRDAIRDYEVGDYPSAAMNGASAITDAASMGLKPLLTKALIPGIALGLSGKSTVKDALRTAYPGVYAKPKEVLDELKSSKGIASENPLLKDLFGVDRRDLDDMTREQAGRSSVDVPVYVPTKGGEYIDQILTPDNTRRVQDFLLAGADEPMLAGSYGWYQAKPLLDKYVSMFGMDEGKRRFLQHHGFGAALSPGTDVNQEIRRMSLANMLHERGDIGGFLDKSGIPEGAGHAYHSTAHVAGLQNYLDRGLPFPEDIVAAPKVRNYYYSRTNENTLWPTMDAHFVRASGLPDVRTRNKGFGESISDEEASRVRDWFTNQVASPIGMEGSPAQALLWNMMGQQTKVKSKLSAPYLELLTNAVQNQAKRSGKTPETVLDEFMAGRGHLW